VNLSAPYGDPDRLPKTVNAEFCEKMVVVVIKLRSGKLVTMVFRLAARPSNRQTVWMDIEERGNPTHK